jgi:glutamate/tyrosine decarboxylase-like PLP-dependent enzyme
LDSRSIFPAGGAATVCDLFPAEIPERGMGEHAFQAVADIFNCSRAQNGRFFGYVLGSGDPVAAVADLLASVLNQNVTAWRSAPAAVTVERAVLQVVAEAIGCQGFTGSLTSGGSSANLMGLAMAREARVPANESGLAGDCRKPVIYASEEVHMSIPKAVAALGIGRQNLRLIRTDPSFRMIPAELDASMRRDWEAGHLPVAVVGSAGTVNTGAIDPLAEIAEIARHHGAWLHVDGAYGALAALASPDKFEGLRHADSLSLDPHKWLYQPLDCGCLLFRDAEMAQKTFAHSGDYARVLSQDPVEGYAFFEESLDLSRRFRALKLWLSLRYHGLGAFRSAIRNDLLHAQLLAESVRKEPRLELLAPVELSAVCFRYRGNGVGTDEFLNRVNENILRTLVKRGRIYLSSAVLRGRFCLRACIVNHRTTERDIQAVVPEVFEAAREVLGSGEF